MAGQGKTTFIAGDILTASQVNGYLMDQVVQVYSGTAARGSALPVPDEGMMTYLADTDKLQLATGTATYVDVYPAVPVTGSVLQVLSTTLTTAVSATPGTNTFTDVTGLSVSITPTSATSKILVSYNLNVGASAGAFVGSRVLRGATAIGVGTAGTAVNFSAVSFVEDNGRIENLSGSVLDSPATTSATTYKLQFAPASGVTIYANRRGAGTDLGNASTITVSEIKA
jgi:hypothetical protein